MSKQATGANKAIGCLHAVIASATNNKVMADIIVSLQGPSLEPWVKSTETMHVVRCQRSVGIKNVGSPEAVACVLMNATDERTYYCGGLIFNYKIVQIIQAGGHDPEPLPFNKRQLRLQHSNRWQWMRRRTQQLHN